MQPTVEDAMIRVLEDVGTSIRHLIAQVFLRLAKMQVGASTSQI